MADWLGSFFFYWCLLSLALAGLYAFLIAKFLSGWQAMPNWELPPGFQPATKVSIIVPARNEEENIIHCLSCIASQSYPKELFEVIVVDDHSTDQTFNEAQKCADGYSNFRVLRLADYLDQPHPTSFKKKAIETGISMAQGELIVTTDADCIAPENWLALLVSFYEMNRVPADATAAGRPLEKYVFIAAPVGFHQERNTFERFQSLDLLGMMCITGAGIYRSWFNMCNGANLAYSRRAFLQVNGFEGIDHLASGDDMLLQQKIAARNPGGIGFLKNKEATVVTLAMPNWKSFLAQRLRWASKSKDFSEKQATMVLALVFLHCCSIAMSLVLAVWWGWKAVGLFAVLLAIKTAADYLFLKNIAHYFARQDLMKSYFPSQIYHIAYIIIVGIWSNLSGQYRWKGRKVT